MAMVAELGPRLGLPPADVAVLVQLVEQHLLLPDVATRRDLADPATAQGVADAVGSHDVLDLLHALTEADSLATGPAAWSPWKARLVGELVGRAGALLAGSPPPPPTPLADWQAELVRRGPSSATIAIPTSVWSPGRPLPMSCSSAPSSSRSGRATRRVSPAAPAAASTRCRSTVKRW